MKITRRQLKQIINEALSFPKVISEAVEKFPYKSNKDSDYQARINKFYDEFGGPEEAGDLYIPDYVPYDLPGAELPDLRFKVNKELSYPTNTHDGTPLNTYLIELYDNQEGRTTFLLVPYKMLKSASKSSIMSAVTAAAANVASAPLSAAAKVAKAAKAAAGKEEKDLSENVVKPAEYPQTAPGVMKEIPIDGQVYVPEFAQRAIQSAIARSDRTPYDSGFEFIGMAPPPHIPGGAKGSRWIGIQNYSDPERPDGYYQDVYLRMSSVVIRDKKTGKEYQVPYDQGTI